MKLVKLAFISLLFFFLLLTGIGLLLPAQVRVSRAIDVAGSGNRVLHMISDTGSWKHWHPLFAHKTTPAVVYITNRTDTSVLATVQTGTNQAENVFILHSYAHTQTQTLQWYQDVRSGWLPWQRLRSLLYEGTYGVLMEQGLKRLDSVQKAAVMQP